MTSKVLTSEVLPEDNLPTNKAPANGLTPAISRRASLTAAAAAATALGLGLAPAAAKASGRRKSSGSKKSSSAATSGKITGEPSPTAPVVLVERTVRPSVEAMAMHRIAFGPRPGDVERVSQMGLEAYLHEQLHPNFSDDAECSRRLSEATLPISYGPQKIGKNLTLPGVHEDRPLRTLSMTTAELWPLMDGKTSRNERTRCVDEVIAAKIIRAIYSKWQLHEVMTDFWHNHFSIDAYITNDASMVTFPVYDRDVIRANALGNFRTFIGNVAKSVPMLVFLNNFASKASPANENFARELFELHTLGAENYYNARFKEWYQVPGAAQEKPIGYIDQDVYEAARAFTGWTFANGANGVGERLPNTGEFMYYDKWHDPYQKRILAHDFDPYQPPMSDGEKVLDLVAYHPGTAHFVCGKLCRRLVSPTPPESLVKKAVHTWMAYQKDPLQIARVIHTIVMSDEFKNTWAEGLKMPFEMMASFFRATGADVAANAGIAGDLARMGEAQFAWPTPNGRPYDAAHWTGTSGMLTRWNSATRWVRGQKNEISLPNPLPMPQVSDWDAVATHWEQHMLGRKLDTDAHQVLTDYISKPFPSGVPDPGNRAYMARTKELIAIIAMTPDFNIR